MGLSQDSDLATGLGSFQQDIKAVRRVEWGDVAQVCDHQTVLIRKTSFNSGCDKIFSDDLLGHKCKYSYVPVCSGLNTPVRNMPKRKILLYRRVHAARDCVRGARPRIRRRAQGSTSRRDRRYRVYSRDPLRLTYPLIIAEEKHFVLPDRPSDIDSELITAEWRTLRIEEVPRIERTATPEIVK